MFCGRSLYISRSAKMLPIPVFLGLGWTIHLQAIFSLAGLLKSSDQMLILCDPTWTQRLFDLLEVSCWISAEIPPFVESTLTLTWHANGRRSTKFWGRNKTSLWFYLEIVELSSFIICQKPWTKEFWTVYLSSVRSDMFCMAPSANPRIVVFVRTGRLFAKPEDTETSLDCQAHGVWQWLFYAFDPLTNTPGLGPSTIYSL